MNQGKNSAMLSYSQRKPGEEWPWHQCDGGSKGAVPEAVNQLCFLKDEI